MLTVVTSPESDPTVVEPDTSEAPVVVPGSPTERPSQAATHLMLMLMQGLAIKAVHAATELGIADLLTEQPRTASELAELTAADVASIRRLLLALVGVGVVQQVEDDVFALDELGQPLRSDSDDSIRGLLRLMCGDEVWQSWGELATTVITGTPGWDITYGISWIELYQRDPDAAAIFNLAMAEQTRDTAAGILEAADLSRFGTVVDLGGGDGTLMACVLQEHPEVTGIVYDVDTACAAGRRRIAGAGVADRCRFVSGDFFESVPREGDAYLLKQVLHDWTDQQALDILRNIRRATPPGSRVFVLERTLPDRPDRNDPFGLIGHLLDLHMLVVTGGRERTAADYEHLLRTSGFDVVRTSDPILPLGFRVIEAIPAKETH